MCIILLALIIILILFLFYHYTRKENFTNENEYVTKLKKIISIIDPEFSDLEIYPGKESVTVDKKRIYVCLRDPDTKEYYPFDVMLYVTLHEIAHLKSKTYSIKNHNEEFKLNFNELLSQAHNKGILQKDVDVPKNYCKKERMNILHHFWS